MKFALFLGNIGHDSGGPEIYETELVRALAKIDQDNEYHLFCLFPNAPKIIGLSQDNFMFHVLRPRSRAISMTVSLPYMSSRIGPQSLHSTFIAPPLALERHLMTLVCMSMFECPEHYPRLIRWRLQALTSLGVRSSHRILCVSEMVKQRAIEHFKVPEERLAVVPLGAHTRFRERSKQEINGYLHSQGITEPYFLFCGRWEKRKNLLGIIEAFHAFKQETKLPHKLVLTGKRTWIANQAEALIDRLGLQGEVIDHGKTPIEELPFLYAGAEALVYASFYESFGMPIVEAMACGTPVITSDITAMPEVAGGAALLVEPGRIESIAAAMHTIATDPCCASKLKSAGLQRAKSFTWEATARATRAAYHHVASGAMN